MGMVLKWFHSFTLWHQAPLMKVDVYFEAYIYSTISRMAWSLLSWGWDSSFGNLNDMCWWLWHKTPYLWGNHMYVLKVGYNGLVYFFSKVFEMNVMNAFTTNTRSWNKHGPFTYTSHWGLLPYDNDGYNQNLMTLPHLLSNFPLNLRDPFCTPTFTLRTR